MRMFLKIYILAYGFSYFTYEASVIPKMLNTKLQFDRFDGSCFGKNAPITVNYTIIKIEKRVIYFNISLKAQEDFVDELVAVIRIYRCKSRDNLDTCEDFLKQEKDYCLMVDPVATRFGPWQIDYKPQYKCPVKKGTYTAYNSKLDTLAAMVVPLESWYWKVRLETFEVKTRRKIQCTQMDAHLVRA